MMVGEEATPEEIKATFGVPQLIGREFIPGGGVPYDMVEPLSERAVRCVLRLVERPLGRDTTTIVREGSLRGAPRGTAVRVARWRLDTEAGGYWVPLSTWPRPGSSARWTAW